MSNDYTFANNVSSALAESISATSTVLNVTSGTGSSFPTLSSGQIFSVTLVDASTGLTREICYCTSVSGDALTVTRGQEGTTALAWSAGDTVAHYITAGALKNFSQPNDFSGYATQSWVNSQGYATQSWVLALGYATQSWVNSQGYATQSWVNSQGYATQSWVNSQNYATQSWVNSQGYATQSWVRNYANGTLSGAQNGFVVLPNGLIFQWGRYVTNSDGVANITFPRAFSNACYNVNVSECNAGGSWFDSQPTVHGLYNLPTQTGCEVLTRGFVNGTFGGAVSASGFFQAIGI